MYSRTRSICVRPLNPSPMEQPSPRAQCAPSHVDSWALAEGHTKNDHRCRRNGTSSQWRFAWCPWASVIGCFEWKFNPARGFVKWLRAFDMALFAQDVQTHFRPLQCPLRRGRRTELGSKEASRQGRCSLRASRCYSNEEVAEGTGEASKKELD